MGADYFDTRAAGKNSRQAFGRAVQDAQYESGHGGYSGTIAEKHDYVLFALPPRITAERFIRLVGEAEDLALGDYAYEVRYARERVANAQKGHVRAAKANLRSVEKLYAQEKKRSERFWKSLRPEVADAVRAAAEVANGDKWGPAACVLLRGTEATAARKYLGAKRGENVYRFFGYASS